MVLRGATHLGMVYPRMRKGLGEEKETVDKATSHQEYTVG